jgi:hypothetical protein
LAINWVRFPKTKPEKNTLPFNRRRGGKLRKPSIFEVNYY